MPFEVNILLVLFPFHAILFLIVGLCKHSLYIYIYMCVFGHCSFCFLAVKATFLSFHVNLKTGKCASQDHCIGPVLHQSSCFKKQDCSSANNTLLISSCLLSTSVVADLQKDAFYLVVFDASVESESSSCNVHAMALTYFKIFKLLSV